MEGFYLVFSCLGHVVQFSVVVTQFLGADKMDGIIQKMPPYDDY